MICASLQTPSTGPAPGWHCLEVGGVSSAVAAWMADRVGPSGSVLVTDIDPRFMERSVYRRPPHLELRRHDIGTDPLPERAFDLIHARLVLMHVPQREGLVTDAEIDAVLARLDTPDFAIFSLVMFTAWGRRLP